MYVCVYEMQQHQTEARNTSIAVSLVYTSADADVNR